MHIINSCGYSISRKIKASFLMVGEPRENQVKHTTKTKSGGSVKQQNGNDNALDHSVVSAVILCTCICRAYDPTIQNSTTQIKQYQK